MVDSDKAAFAAAIGAMLETHGQQATKPILHGYWLGLSDLSLEAVQVAVAASMRSLDRVPKPADLRKLAGEKTSDQRAIAAWSDVQAAVPRGSYRHIDFEDKLINATIRHLGGWPQYLDRFDGGESEKWARIDFEKTYKALEGSGVSHEACAALPGLSQKTAIGGEVVNPQPVRIGCDADRARLAAPARRTAIESNAAAPRLELKNARSV